MAAAGTRGAGPAGGTAVLVDKKSVAINSQLISCTASEVAAMIEGAMHHRTEMDVQANYVDSHGQSEVGFGLTRLLGFELKPRLKRINVTKLYLPDTDIRPRIPDLLPVLSKQGSIRWELIAQQYDQLIKYATPINNRTASTEAILRRFTVIWKIDRLGPNLRNLIDITTLESRGVGVQSLTNGIVDTTTAHGKLVFGMFALMAE